MITQFKIANCYGHPGHPSHDGNPTLATIPHWIDETPSDNGTGWDAINKNEDLSIPFPSISWAFYMQISWDLHVDMMVFLYAMVKSGVGAIQRMVGRTRWECATGDWLHYMIIPPSS